MKEFVAFVIGVILMGLIWITVDTGIIEQKLRACAQANNVFKCEQIITYVPILKEKY